jgi:hypothetical protein
VNIFALDTDPALAAQAHCDRHVVKMILESAQLLSTALARHDPGQHARLHAAGLAYRVTHAGHPCTLWAAEARANFLWLCELADGLLVEHRVRYAPKAPHRSTAVLAALRGSADSIPAGPLTSHAQAMPEELRGPDPVRAYRAYYASHKAVFADGRPATWRAPRSRPDWMVAV